MSTSVGMPVYYIYDALGSMVFEWQGTSLEGSAVYKAFGEVLESSGAVYNHIGSPFLWNARDGYWYDADLGMNYARRREYQPVIGRWMSVDPLGLRPDPNNPFRYVFNRTVGMNDPGGFGLGGVVYSPKGCPKGTHMVWSTDFDLPCFLYCIAKAGHPQQPGPSILSCGPICDICEAVREPRACAACAACVAFFAVVNASECYGDCTSNTFNCVPDPFVPPEPGPLWELPNLTATDFFQFHCQ
jgi:RHS repeat-associated protein